METTLTQVNPVEYDFEIQAADAELAPRIEQALKQQRATVNMKGFRPGRVPLSLLKKMFGKAISYEIAEKYVHEVFETEILKSDDHKVFGQPKATVIEYEPGEVLRAVIRFGVRPEIELKDVSGETVTKYVHEFTEKEVEEEMERRLDRLSTLEPSDEPVSDDSYVTLDLQLLDERSHTPIIGERQEDAHVFLGDQELDPDLKKKLLGKSVGGEFRVDLSQEDAEAESGSSKKPFSITVKKVQKKITPELNEDTIKRISDGRAEDADSLRASIREEMQTHFERQSRDLLENAITDKMIELHPVPIPDSAIEYFLDSFVEDVKNRNKGQLPEGFDVEAFKEQNRADAEKVARWTVIEEAVRKQNDIEATEDDIDQYFQRMSDGTELSADDFRRFYKQAPQMEGQLRQRILVGKVYDALIETMNVVDKAVGEDEEGEDEKQEEMTE